MATERTGLVVDLNSDMGEGFGAWRMGDDSAMLDIVSSANVACGMHAGDPEVMANTFAKAQEKGVSVGAHPGYPDLWGFGRRNIPFTMGETERLIAYQIGAAEAMATYAGHKITHVKLHGALGNLGQQNRDVALAACRAIKAVNPNLVCLTIALGEMEKIAPDMGLEIRSEIFADRAYTDDGYLVDRKLPGAVIHEPVEIARRILSMLRNGAIESVSGKKLPTPIHSICVHSDTPSAVDIARRLRVALETAGITIRPFAAA
ncbi:LamB/YcsF family protein [Rhizobium sp. KVB221]|uniref:5-oxoprolinase subunit A n=1 Tax=Rhizobium setariae TaxID=2801340 RepID=A0A936YU94_9HYPH|nr:5-oxoprolinase subunit PxpA [Rhizobium setariae]MBL0372675.1 LamB/YcsF family protein [Rhizobium setariae]